MSWIATTAVPRAQSMSVSGSVLVQLHAHGLPRSRAYSFGDHLSERRRVRDHVHVLPGQYDPGRLRAGHVYRMTLVVPAGKDYDLFIWTPGTKEVWQFRKLRTYSARSGSVDESVRFKARTTGTYYIRASAWIFKSGRYTLRFRRVS